MITIAKCPRCKAGELLWLVQKHYYIASENAIRVGMPAFVPIVGNDELECDRCNYSELDDQCHFRVSPELMVLVTAAGSVVFINSVDDEYVLNNVSFEFRIKPNITLEQLKVYLTFI